MNEEQLIEFVNWLPTAVPEFQNASPDQIVQSLNQMAESEEGQQMLSQLFTAFQESKQTGNSQMFKKGGKMAAFVNKYGNGGCVSCKKKEILRGGMVNKMAEKMQDGNKMPTKSINSVLFPSMNYDYSNLTKPFDENGNIVDTTQSNNPNIFQRLKNWWQRNTQPTIITEPARSPEQIDSLLNVPRPSFFGSPRRKQTTSVLAAQKGGELATMTSAETANNIGLIPKAQRGNDTIDWHTKSILEVLPQMQFARRRTYGPGFVDEMSAYADSLDNATLGRLIMPNPTSGQQDTTYFRFFNNPMAEPVYMPLTGNAKRQVDDKFDNTLKKSKNK